MSDSDKDPTDKPTPQEPEDSGPQLDDDEMRLLLKRALQVEPQAPARVLPEVQKKIRQRSRGKFFADGWSTTASPRSTYFVTSLVMLALALALYFALVPGGWGTP